MLPQSETLITGNFASLSCGTSCLFPNAVGRASPNPCCDRRSWSTHPSADFQVAQSLLPKCHSPSDLNGSRNVASAWRLAIRRLTSGSSSRSYGLRATSLSLSWEGPRHGPEKGPCGLMGHHPPKTPPHATPVEPWNSTWCIELSRRSTAIAGVELVAVGLHAVAGSAGQEGEAAPSRLRRAWATGPGGRRMRLGMAGASAGRRTTIPVPSYTFQVAVQATRPWSATRATGAT